VKKRNLAIHFAVAVSAAVASAQASDTVSTEDVSRFDGHYKLVRQDQAYERIWGWKCPGATLISSNGNSSSWDATGTCSLDEGSTIEKACASEFYVKGEQALPGQSPRIFYGESPLKADLATTFPALVDDNVSTNTCKQNHDTWYECFFEKTVAQYSKTIHVSTSTLVSNEYHDNAKRFSLLLLEKKDGLLIVVRQSDGSSTNGNGKFVKDSEQRLKCAYRLAE